MKKKYVWQVSITVIVFLLSIVSALAEIHGAIMIDNIASICYIVALSVFIYMDFSLAKEMRYNVVDGIDNEKVRSYEDLVKVKKSRLRKRSSIILTFLLLIVVVAGIVIQYSDVNIIVKNVFGVLFALGLMIKTIIDKIEFENSYK